MRRPGTAIDVLPGGQLDGGITTGVHEAEADLLGKIAPEVRHAEHLLGEDVGLGSRLGPLVELIEDLGSALDVLERRHSENGRRHGVHTALPVEIGRVVGGRLPNGHCAKE